MKTLALFLFSSIAFAQSISGPIQLGFAPNQPGNLVGSRSLTNTTGTPNQYLAMGFQVTVSGTLDSVRMYMSAITGGPITISNFIACLYLDDATTPGNPSASGSTQCATTLTPSSVNAAGEVDFSGFSTALTAGTQYWIVFSNTLSGCTVTMRYTASLTSDNGVTALTKTGWVKAEGTNGTTWGTKFGLPYGLRVKTTSPTAYYGMAVQNIALIGVAFGTTEGGVKFTLPGTSGLTWNAVGISCYPNTSSAPAGPLSYKLYTGAGSVLTSVATTSSVAANALNLDTGWRQLDFSSPQAIPGGTTVRIVAATNASTLVGAPYYMYQYTIDNDANSFALMPFGSYVGTSGAFNSGTGQTTFTDTATTAYPCLLVMADSPVTVSGTGGQAGYPLRR